MDATFRVINLVDRSEVGQTAATPELAKLVAEGLNRSCRLGLERTDWSDNHGRLKPYRTIVVEAEPTAGDWDLGV